MNVTDATAPVVGMPALRPPSHGSAADRHFALLRRADAAQPDALSVPLPQPVAQQPSAGLWRLWWAQRVWLRAAGRAVGGRARRLAVRSRPVWRHPWRWQFARPAVATGLALLRRPLALPHILQRPDDARRRHAGRRVDGGRRHGGRARLRAMAAAAGCPRSPSSRRTTRPSRRLLKGMQAAWSAQDLAALRSVATPEMTSYFAEQLAELTSRGCPQHRFGRAVAEG